METWIPLPTAAGAAPPAAGAAEPGAAAAPDAPGAADDAGVADVDPAPPAGFDLPHAARNSEDSAGIAHRKRPRAIRRARPLMRGVDMSAHRKRSMPSAARAIQCDMFIS